ncbi:MAG: protein kinase domain-containing protein, partial [bacterium]
STGGLRAARWLELSPHLDRALAMSTRERSEWLETLRTEDPRLAAELAALLEERRALSQEGFLEGGPTLPSLAGQAMGAYRLVSLLGQGGMGTVWLAERSDGQFRGQAAVKILNAAMVGHQSEVRFKREGSILARLTHPHIAHLVDAGVSPSGQPDLVLEHVEGHPIDSYADAQGLTVDARIRLFLDVLAAVAHAHANLIVHRDIKPLNVLVGTDGQVKLLDFGIAKLLEEEGGGDPTLLTREGGGPLTPQYAAPEQVTGGVITTATDVYALGALLYLLLAGRHPAGEAVRTPADLLKAIVETQPQRLSEAVSDAKTQRLLRGDLETIVAKALKKAPEERYTSVTAFADDLRRYLDHEPISARKDTLAYRTGMFVRRNRTTVGLAALVVLALAIGLAGTITQARRATRHALLAEEQRRRADQEARTASEQRDFALRQLSRAERTNDLNNFLLYDAAPSGRPFTVGDLLARAEEVVDREQGEAGEDRVDMLIDIGRLHAVRDEDDQARRLLERAYTLAGQLKDRSLRAKASCALGNAVAKTGDPERAEALVREGLAALPDEPQLALERVFCLLRGSEVAREVGDVTLAVQRAEAAQRVAREPQLSSAVSDLTVSLDLAESYRVAGRHREAAATFQQSFDRLSSLGRDQTEKAGTLLNNWALAVDFLGRPQEAEALYRKAVKISSADGSLRGVSPMLLNNLSRSLRELHRLEEAQDYTERAYAEARRAGDEMVVNQSLFERARVYRERGLFARADSALSELTPRLRRMMSPGHGAFASLASEKALLAEARRDFAAARAASDEAVAIAEASRQRTDSLPRMLLRRSNLFLQMDHPEQARADAARALELWQPVLGDAAFSSWRGRASLALGRALQAQGKPKEARPVFLAALHDLEPALGRDHPDTRAARELAASEPPGR